jgi:DNA-binding CsgD family transcriptional regulator
MILEMLEQGIPSDQIVKNLYVSEEYVEMIEELAEEEGLLPRQTD